ncbi:hypothetical protein AT15_04535 [Kosmotoga arenicorallina S304]|uniref:4-hydroxy-3-methylbut-2-enyl diphosphate reductase n=1 Tax=Kosmotoga arenicorallina S304 TaxID=1453497 RepID=A0A176JXM9_9BACT|nr:4-hydroxy-3-methylbut-2-enyl diphosphate reductase [Kosmotoga arenicorallina]OAA28473.1 hypothetical protein AT15_04535 [Kosmotoga arenicorallina S304]
MKVYVAASTGFCYGVNRAVSICERLLKNGIDVYTNGELVHNEEVVGNLKKMGLKILEGEKPVIDNEFDSSTFAVRAHGISPEIERDLRKSFRRVVDLTCPIVYNVFRLAEGLEKKGYLIVVYGKKGHAEVDALCGRLNNYLLVEPSYDLNEVFSEILKKRCDKVAIISQTTMNHKDFMEFSSQIEQSLDAKIDVFDTICSVTVKREEEARRLAEVCDAVIVVGGKKSSNTRKLAQIVQDFGKSAFHVREPDELPELSNFEKIGLISGTSTPYVQIQRILDYIETKYEGEVIHNG